MCYTEDTMIPHKFFLLSDLQALESKRKELGLSQQDVANSIGVTLSTYSRWLGAKTSPTSAATIENFHKVLKQLGVKK